MIYGIAFGMEIFVCRKIGQNLSCITWRMALRIIAQLTQVISKDVSSSYRLTLSHYRINLLQLVRNNYFLFTLSNYSIWKNSTCQQLMWSGQYHYVQFRQMTSSLLLDKFNKLVGKLNIILLLVN